MSKRNKYFRLMNFLIYKTKLNYKKLQSIVNYIHYLYLIIHMYIRLLYNIVKDIITQN